MDVPEVFPVRQIVPPSPVRDVAAEVRRCWLESPTAKRLGPGRRVAVGVGSRGIANILTIVKATLGALRELGAEPFVVSAMGSHGGATAEGQRDLLASYGVTPDNLGVPVLTDMTAVPVGTNSWGETVWWDKNALAADAAVTVSRVKPHTDFIGRFESGILKMIVIGLGKRDGASQHHRWGLRGLRDMMPETAKVVLEKTPFVGGLAVLENAREETAHLRVVDRDELFEVEPGLLDQARAIMGRIPFDQLDLLVIGEIGKNYSGAGIDPNVVGRLLMECGNDYDRPKITRICALDLSPECHGNATGIGIADLTTQRLIDGIDQGPFRMNNLTACFLWRSKLPLPFATDRDCLAAGLATCWQPRPEAVRMAVIPNTLEVEHLWVSKPVADEARGVANLAVGGPGRPLPFDGAGNLRQEELFPHSVRGRRGAATASHAER